MGARNTFPCSGKHRPHNEKDPGPPDSHTVDETPLQLEKCSLEAMTTRLCPYGYEMAEDNLTAPRDGLTELPTDEILSLLTRHLEAQKNVKVLDWKQHAAEKETLLIGILTWALNLIDTTHSLQESLRNVLTRFARAQDQVLALQREQEEAAGVRASLELRLDKAVILLKTAEDRARRLRRRSKTAG